MCYFARFEMIYGHLFRFDTRIYLTKYERDQQDICVGAIIGKNPGSARPETLSKFLPLNLNGDKMLPSVRNRFLEAYKRVNKVLPNNAFVRVWNLFYICQPDLVKARAAIAPFQHKPYFFSKTICPSETESPNIVWFAWGGYDKSLNSFKNRFLSRHITNGFSYDSRISAIVPRAPSINEFAKHPQGMPAEPIVVYLAGKL